VILGLGYLCVVVYLYYFIVIYLVLMFYLVKLPEFGVFRFFGDRGW